MWDGYNAFYGRSGPTALSPEITAMTWARKDEEVGLFLWAETNYVVEVHVAASPAPGEPR